MASKGKKAFQESKAKQKQEKNRRILFSKRLSSTDVGKRFAIPTKCLAFLPSFCGGYAQELVVKDENGHYWTFVCSIRKAGTYQKPVLQQGWREFVRAKCLDVGDKLTLYEQEDEDGIKIFGSILPRSRYGVEIQKTMGPLVTTAANAPLVGFHHKLFV